MKTKKILLLLSLLFCVFLLLVLSDYFQSIKDNKKIDQLNLSLTGIVTKKESFTYGHGYGFVLIDIYKSNYSDFDPREKKQDYFFIIKQRKCVFVFGGISRVQIGDSIVVNKRDIFLYRNNKKVDEHFEVYLLPSIYCDNPDVFFNQ